MCGGCFWEWHKPALDLPVISPSLIRWALIRKGWNTASGRHIRPEAGVVQFGKGERIEHTCMPFSYWAAKGRGERTYAGSITAAKPAQYFRNVARAIACMFKPDESAR